jgi:ParB family chromosome partitioning protein
MNPESKKKVKLAAAAEAQDPNVREAQDRLQRRLGLKVRIEDKRGKGRVIIEYAGVEDFDAILAALGEG